MNPYLIKQQINDENNEKMVIKSGDNNHAFKR